MLLSRKDGLQMDDTRLLEMIEIYQRGNEMFMSQITVLITVFSSIAVLLAIALPVFQYISTRSAIKGLEARTKAMEKSILSMDTKFSELENAVDGKMAALDIRVEEQFRDMAAQLELKFEEQFKKMSEQISMSFESFVEGRKEMVDNKTKAVIADIDKAAKQAQNIQDIYANPKWLKAQQGYNKLDAVRLYEELLIEYSGHFLIWQSLGMLYHFDMANYTKSTECFKEVLSQEPTNPYALLMMAKNFKALGNTEEAEHFFKKAGMADGHNRTELVKFYISQEKLEQASEVLSRMNEEASHVVIGGNSYKPIYILKAFIRFLCGDTKKAQELLRESTATKEQIVRELRETGRAESIDGMLLLV